MAVESEIRWGTGFDNAIAFSYPKGLDDVRTWRRPAPGSRRTRNAAGVTDSWINKRDFVLAGRARWFSSQYWGGNGLQDFLDWAGEGNAFRFLPDTRCPLFYIADCYLDEPFDDPAPILEEADGSQSIEVTIRQQAYDFHLAMRGLLFEYVPGKSITDPSSMAATYTRAGTAKRVNRDLVVTEETSGTLRDRHFIGTTRTTLLELARTNGISKSQEFDHADWTKTRATASANATTAPDGTGTAEKIVEDGSATTTHLVSRTPPAMTNNTVQSFSVYAKAGERSWIALELVGKDGTGRSAYFNLTAGAGAVGTTSNATARIVALASDWYRCELMATGGAGAGAGTISIYLASGDNGASYSGDGASGAYLWGAQFEADGVFATTYIPTTTGSASRVTDNLAFPFSFAPQVMSIYVKVIEGGTVKMTGGSERLFNIGGAGSAPAMAVYNNTAGSYRADHNNNITSVLSASALTPSIGDTVEVLVTLTATGVVQITVSVNAGTATAASASAANALASAWSATTIFLNSAGASAAGANNFQIVRVAAGVKTMAEMRAI